MFLTGADCFCGFQMRANGAKDVDDIRTLMEEVDMRIAGKQHSHSWLDNSRKHGVCEVDHMSHCMCKQACMVRNCCCLEEQLKLAATASEIAAHGCGA